ncbi:hypothetical protein CSC18_2257 [Klebsiella aerogenes]|nr:hypothetical protein CSC18_2257 [Klebsiella aerogenes]
MTKSTITREQVIALIAEHSYDSALVDALEHLLAAMDSEPVAYMHDGEDGTEYNGHNEFSGGGKGIPLYRHAQPAPVVDADDNFYSWFGREWHENYQHNQYTTAAKQMLGVMAESAWKAGRRAAMLQDEPVTTANKLGNSPAIPDTWIPVSERMPEKNQSVLISVNFDSTLVEPLICSARYTGSTFRRGDVTVKPGDGVEQATHWMPLPAAPQEVKGE